jgi:hypothetical protein
MLMLFITANAGFARSMRSGVRSGVALVTGTTPGFISGVGLFGVSLTAGLSSG